MGKKSRTKKENPGRHYDIVKYRGMGNTMEWFTDSTGKSYIINITKRMISKGEYINQDVQSEVNRRLHKFIQEKLQERKEKTATNAPVADDVQTVTETV